MNQWTPLEIKAHMDYYRALNRELTETGELVANEALTGPEHAMVVTCDGSTAPVIQFRRRYATSKPAGRRFTAHQ